MNKLTLIGNLTRNPERRTTGDGAVFTSFSVAVSRRKKPGSGQPETDYFEVAAWRELGEICFKYLSKGRKVCVVGPVSAAAYISRRTGQPCAALSVFANEVEFLSPREEAAVPVSPESAPADAAQAPSDPPSGFIRVDTDDLPF